VGRDTGTVIYHCNYYTITPLLSPHFHHLSDFAVHILTGNNVYVKQPICSIQIIIDTSAKSNHYGSIRYIKDMEGNYGYNNFKKHP
jgi:hypothetical protein